MRVPDGKVSVGLLDVEAFADGLLDHLAPRVARVVAVVETPRAHLLGRQVAAEEHPGEDEAQLPDVVRGAVGHRVLDLRRHAECRAHYVARDRDARVEVVPGVRQARAAQVADEGLVPVGHDPEVALGEVHVDHARALHGHEALEHVDHHRQGVLERHHGLPNALPLRDLLLQSTGAQRLRQHVCLVADHLRVEHLRHEARLAH
mmetsp:Transcript_49683/g.142975  ORF Transcript_49683/g.142975 Transcript_49683/m.142975 type:complete len:204 (+) Transcript_49683:361-972(+)